MEYMRQVYPAAFDVDSSNWSSATEQPNYDLAVNQAVLRYAFRSCQQGTVRSPPHGNCVTVPESLVRAMMALEIHVNPGADSLPPECPRFDPDSNCTLSASPDACLW